MRNIILIGNEEEGRNYLARELIGQVPESVYKLACTYMQKIPLTLHNKGELDFSDNKEAYVSQVARNANMQPNSFEPGELVGFEDQMRGVYGDDIGGQILYSVMKSDVPNIISGVKKPGDLLYLQKNGALAVGLYSDNKSQDGLENVLGMGDVTFDLNNCKSYRDIATDILDYLPYDK